MQISAESIKFYFYTEYAPKNNRESELNLSFDKKKDRLALGFFKVSCRLYVTTKTKARISNLLLSIKFTRSLPLKIYRKGEANSIFGKNKKRFFSLAFFKYTLCVTRQSLKYWRLQN